MTLGAERRWLAPKKGGGFMRTILNTVFDLEPAPATFDAREAVEDSAPSFIRTDANGVSVRGEFSAEFLNWCVLHGKDPRAVAAIQAMAEAVLWHCWPKMTASPEREPSIRFSLGWEDEDIPVPDPDGHPELREFARALR